MSVRRSDRLEALLHHLRAADTTTVPALADALGVTARTVHRDLAVLRDRGHPIASATGRAGGVRLDGRSGVTSVQLTLGEAVALWLAARLAAEASALPWGRTARGALTKLLASLPRARARALRELLARVVVGPPPSAKVRQGLADASGDLLPVLESALTDAHALSFSYIDAAGRTSVRHAEPHGLLLQPPAWYVIAFDLDRRAARTFRMDRIHAPRALRRHRFRPDPAIVRSQLAELGSAWTTLAPGFLR